MRKKVLAAIFAFAEKKPWFVIIISLLLGIIFFTAFFSINLKSDYIDLLPKNSPSVKTMRYMTEKLKGVGMFYLVLESPSRNMDGMISASEVLYNRLNELEEIQYIQYKIPLDFIKKHFYLFINTDDLDEIYKRLREQISYELWKDVPVFIDLEEDLDEAPEFKIDDILDKYQVGGATASASEYMISADKELLLLLMKPGFMPTEMDKTKDLIEKVDEIVENANIKQYGEDINIFYAGSYKLALDQKNAIFSDISRTSIIALAVIFLAILFFVRNIRYSLFLLIALAIGVTSAFGLAFVTLGHINLITGFLMAILTGLGVNYGIHFLIRYREETEGNFENALKTSFISTGRASLIGALTTAISFFTLIFSKFLGFSEFGLLSSFGIVMTLLSTYILVAALIVASNKLLAKKAPAQAHVHVKKEVKFPVSEESTRKIIYSVSIVLIILTLSFAYFIKNIRFEYNSKKLEVKNQESIITTEKVQQKFNISTDPTIYYTYSREEEEDFYTTVSQLMEKENSYIGNVMSLTKIVPPHNEQLKKMEIVQKINKELAEVEGFKLKDEDKQEKLDWFKENTKVLNSIDENNLPGFFKNRFYAEVEDSKRLYITQVFPNKILFDALEMKEFVSELKEVKGKLRSYFPTGMHILYVFLIDTVFKESRIFITLVFFIIWLILLIDFRNIKDSLIAMVPLVFGVIWLLEIMAVLGIKFNFMNIIVLPIVLGTGVDNGVHLYHRYKETGSIFTALYKTGIANLGMSLTVALGWASLYFARYEGLKTMALVGVTGILLTFLGSVTIMPMIIMLTEKKRKTE